MPKPTVPELLGRNVRHLREARGLSQEGLAELAGLHRTYIGMVERGEASIGIENVARIAHALGVTVSRLTRGL